MFKSRLGSVYGLRRHAPRTRLSRDRANLSFFIVVFFFTIFGIIIVTEVLMMDEKGRSQGVGIRKHGRRYMDRFDYEDAGEEDSQYQDKNFDANLAALLDDPARTKPGKGNKERNEEIRVPSIDPSLPVRDAEWQTVNGARYKFLVYSAFYDGRNGRNIRIIGATKTRGADRVWCRFWYPPSGNQTTLSYVFVPAQVKMIRENWNLRYSACFLVCPIRKNLTVPGTVSVVARLRLPPSNLLLVRSSNKTVPSNGLSVCVKPLHFDYNKPLTFLEFVELYRILGVDHFTLYNHTTGPEVSCIIKQYQERGLVTVLPWQLNMKSQKEIRTEGLFAALNDCLYRNMYNYSYLALVDLDEFIIPRRNDTLLELIGLLERSKWMQTRVSSKTTGSYSFQNAFFYLQWEDDPMSAGLDPGMVTLRKTRRKTKLHPHKQRSKYICRPELVVEAGNHFVWEFLVGYATVNVSPEAAILHHYRVCEFGGDDCVKTASTVDRTAFRYKERLLNKLEERWKEFGKVCHLTPPSW